MRAAEDHDVRAEAADRLEVLAGDQPGRRMIHPALRDERDEQRAWLAHDLGGGHEPVQLALVRARGDRAGGAEHADPAGAGGAYRGAGARLDHAQHRDAEPLPEHVDGVGRGRVARDDDHLGAAREEEGGGLGRVAADRRRRLGAVGHARRVAEVDDRFVRQAVHQLPHDRQSANPGVEHTDRTGRVTHSRRPAATLIPIEMLPSSRRPTSSSPGKSVRWAAT